MKPGAFFDLDRTLVPVNTAVLYQRAQQRRGDASWADMAQLAWWMLQYTLGVVDAKAIARVASRPMRGRDEAEFRERLAAWVRNDVLPLVSDGARNEVARCIAKGMVCAILTSSTPYSADPLARALGVEHVLASRLEVIDGRFTGEMLEPLCYGRGKVELAEQWAAANDVDLARSAFYTDSISDRPMLERVADPVAVNPDPRLRWLAWRRGWRVEKW